MTAPFPIPNSNNSCWFAAATQALLSVTRITPQHLMAAGQFPATAHAGFYAANIDASKISAIRDSVVNNSAFTRTINSSKSGDATQLCVDEYVRKVVSCNDRMFDLCKVGISMRSRCKICQHDTGIKKYETACIEYYQNTPLATTAADFSKNLRGIFDDFTANCEKCGKLTEWRRVYATTNVGGVILVHFVHAVNHPLFTSFAFPVRRKVNDRIVDDEWNYNLVALIMHGGNKDPRTQTSGHYYAAVKRGDKWYSANDGYIAEASHGLPNSTLNVTMAVYERE